MHYKELQRRNVQLRRKLWAKEIYHNAIEIQIFRKIKNAVKDAVDPHIASQSLPHKISLKGEKRLNKWQQRWEADNSNTRTENSASASNVSWLAACLSALIPLLSLSTGCSMNDSTVKQMIYDMGVAYAATVQKGGDTHEDRDAAVALAVQKYFQTGMKEGEAFKLLNRLHEDGFRVTETRHEGIRLWPNGELRPYLSDTGRLTHQRRYPKGISEFSAHKQVSTHLFIVTNHVAISFQVVDGSGTITNTRGKVWSNGV